MSTKNGPSHVVVDGSNIATEGRSMPSLAQLSEAVAGFMEEHPDTAITVVVDATFGHRIDKSEVPEFEGGIANNELVAPPAGAVGRGDAFVLGIANKAGASVLSNDSFQEFHADYEWLFDEGRLIGGKPVPHVGWVWVDRVPVRGPVSRKATRGTGSKTRSSGGRSRRRSGSDDDSTVRIASKEASQPMPTPKSPPPGRAGSNAPSTPTASVRASKAPSTTSSTSTSKSTSVASSTGRESTDASKPAPKGGEPVNELMPFIEFVENHPVGTSINATVDAYSSHGAYVTVASSDVRAYVPLRLLADPAPRSARSVVKIGESVTLVVVSFAPARRSIDCAVPDLAERAIAEAASDADGDDVVAAAAAMGDAPSSGGRRKRAATEQTATKKTAAKKTAAKKAAVQKTATKKAAVKKTSAKKAAVKKTAAVTKTAVATAPAAKKPAAKKTATPRTGTAPVKKTAVKKAAVQKTAVKKAAVTKTAVTKTPVTKTAVKKAAVQKTAVKKTAVKKSAVKKSAVRSIAVKQTVAAKAPAKKAAAKKTAAKKTAAVKRTPTPRSRA